MNVAQPLVGVVVEVLAKDERRHQLVELVEARSGQRARLEPRVALPRAALRDQILLERRVRDRERPALAVRPQPHVDAEHVAVGRAVVQRADHATAQPLEELAIGDGARAVGLAVVRVDEDQVDVRRYVELEAAELAHAEDHELLRDAVGIARLAVFRGDRAVMEAKRRAQRVLRESRHRRADFGERRATGEIARHRMQEHAQAQQAQRCGERIRIAAICACVERRGGRFPVERRVERRFQARALVGACIEHARRVAAVGEGGGEVGGGRHRTHRAARWAGYNRASDSIMPSARAFLRAPGALMLALARILRTVVVVGFGAFALALLALRFFVLPHIESYRDTIASALTKELGHPVEIATLTTDWDGWNPKLLVQGLRVLESARSDASPLVDLPEVALVVSWTSVPLMELRLKELVIERPRLAIRRNRAGHLQVAGIEFDPTQTDGESALADWILQQREIVVRDALITWDDDLRNAPQLVLDRVQFKMENGFGRHRFGLRGTPPSGLAAPIDVRGDLKDVSLRDWQRGEGRMFVRLDYADVGAWREWLPLPQQISSGKGAMRVWFRFADGKPREVVADLELRDVSAKLGDDLPELDLTHLSGRAGWKATASGREIFTQALAFTTEQGERLDPMNFKLTVRDDASRPAGQMEFDRLQLEPLVAIAANLPLATRVRGDLARFAPRGTLADGRLRWEGTAESPTSYAASAEFTNLGVIAQDELPGITGISGRFTIAHDRGEIRVTSNGSVLALPRVFEAPIAFSSLQSVAKWERREGRTAVRVEQFEFANADAAGSASGTYRTTPQGPGEIDITAQVSRVDARRVHAYLPRVIDEPTRRWLRTSLTAGVGADARLKLAGNLTQFPFANGKGGQFVVTAKARGVTLAYAPSWPAIEAVDADLRFEGTRMKIDATRGRAFGVDIAKARAEIADIIADHPLLTIEGEAGGPVAGFLQYVNESPVVGWLELPGKASDAAGNGRLALKLALPLRELETDSKASGEFTLNDAQMRIGTLPLLTRLNGKVAFTEHEVRAHELTMETLGGPAKVDIATSDGRARITGGGTLTIAALRREQPSEFLDKVAGGTDWAVAASLRQGTLAWTLQSSMKGASVDLPAPLGKAAGESMPLRIERRDDAAQAGADVITASYGGIAQLAAHRKLDAKGISVDRALLSLGKAIERSDADRAERPGLWVRAELPALNVDDWITVLRREGGSAAASERNRWPRSRARISMSDSSRRSASNSPT